MMRWLAYPLVALAFLAGCDSATQDRLSRDAARAAITPVVVQKFPNAPVEPGIDCVGIGAKSREYLSLAADSLTGPTANTTQIVSNIASRPATLRCLVGRGLPALL